MKLSNNNMFFKIGFENNYYWIKKNSKENKKREPSFEGSLFLLILNLMFKYLL